MNDSVRDGGDREYVPLTLGRYAVDGMVYLVNFSTAGRRALFSDYLTASTVCRCIIDARLWHRAHLLGWVLMPDTWHGLVRVTQFDDLAIVVERIKTQTVHGLRRERPGLGKVWASGFEDRLLRTEQDLLKGARAVVTQPVRAGIVAEPGDYPYWNAVWL
ncbi:MAG TPA: transposase [Pseudoxanthomonas sp.]|nr:transposase [Pseudoxanthomonas sp.]